MSGNSEGYSIKLREMRQKLEVDERQLGQMIRSGARLDLFHRDRETLEREIEQQVRRIKIAASY